MRTESDIDLFIGLSDETDDVLAQTRVAELARKVSIWTGNDARPLVYRASEIAPAPMFDSIVTEGHTVYGDTNWLGRKAARSKGRVLKTSNGNDNIRRGRLAKAVQFQRVAMDALESRG